MKRYNWLLHNLGIVQWRLRRHLIVSNDVSITLPSYICLLLVTTDVLPMLGTHQFFCDVARSMSLSIEQFLILHPKQVRLISEEMITYHVWWMNVNPVRDFNGVVLNTPSLSIICNNPEVKKDLWKQINSYGFVIRNEN
ncbi:DNA polymerase III subunit psi [Blochmannia endosymbiont of Colobopsis nipponica]|uniref:DNA polymerase III subunit psi n=1 Tax=Blochmannia endosymbiont of Colobopsis nipponica TaxID=2681987 RepID=UPI001780DA94|nr:DNA polymerase III subunit psi [Blochmannia endosymbiont of Colobopsis nipponica]QOI11296.1 DNA polymerase III subunit psi [Blochmannia endosymbiont of Colobopsis nipponica]